MATPKKEAIILCKGYGSPILKCLGEKKESDFLTSWSPFFGAKIPFCKDCCNKMFEYYKKETKSEKVALYYTLMKLDAPFIKECYEALDKKGKITVNGYLTELHKKSAKKELYNDFSATDIELKDIDKVVKTKEEMKDKLSVWEKEWGKQDDLSDYEFLEETFERYTSDKEEIDPRQNDLFKDLCRDRLLLRKINDGRYGGEETIDKIQTRISKLMGTLKIDQFEVTKPKTLSEQLIFNKIAMIEQTKPADLYKEPKKYKDFNKVRQYYKDICLRPLLNTLVGHKDFDIDIDDLQKYNLED